MINLKVLDTSGYKRGRVMGAVDPVHKKNMFYNITIRLYYDILLI